MIDSDSIMSEREYDVEEVSTATGGGHQGVGEALVRASHLLLAGRPQHMQEVLEVVGRALEARCIAVTIYETGKVGEPEYFEWPSSVGAAHASSPNGIANGHDAEGSLSFPIMSASGRLLGSLDYLYRRDSDEEVGDNSRVLSVLSNLLASYLERRATMHKLRTSRDRYQRLVRDLPMPVFVITGDKIVYANRSSSELVGVPAQELIGRSYLDFVPATLFGELGDRWQAAIGGRRLDPLRHEIIRQNGEERLVESLSLPFVYDGEEGVEVILRDITELSRSEERYRAFLTTSSQAFWNFQLDRPLPAHLDEQGQVDFICRHARLVEANVEFARLIGREGFSLEGYSYRALLGRDARLLAEDFVRQGFSFQNKRYQIRTDGVRRHFVINAISTGQRESPLVRIWGTCVEVTEQIELERRMVHALEEQQEQFARDLHDSIGQLLTGVRMLSGNLLERHFSEGDSGFALAEKIARFAEQANHGVRDLYRGLAPRQLVNEGLVSALDEIATRINEVGAAHAIFLHDGSFDVTHKDVRLQLYRIVQEATNNTLKHAEAENVWIQLTRDEDSLIVQVEDDGKGFVVSETSTQSLGLYSMRYRAHSIHGELTLDTDVGRGTVVRCDVPLATLGDDRKDPE